MIYKKKRSLKNILINSWLTLVFIILSFVVYEKLSSDQRKEETELQDKLVKIERQRLNAIEEQQELQRYISSLDDYTWQELTLIKDMGLVPEDQTKIYFYEEQDL